LDSHIRDLEQRGKGEKGQKGAATYYVPTERLLNPTAATAPNPVNLDIEPSGTPAASRPVATLPTGFQGNLQGLPTELADAVRKLGQRASPASVRAVIRQLCSWRTLSSEQLSEILGRNQHHIISTHLRPMLRDGELEYLYPDQPAHPQQAYKAT
jgi:ATP-dependent DNA helicase RecG